MDAVGISAMAEVGEAMKSRTTANKTRPAASICSTYKGWKDEVKAQPCSAAPMLPLCETMQASRVASLSPMRVWVC